MIPGDSSPRGDAPLLELRISGGAAIDLSTLRIYADGRASVTDEGAIRDATVAEAEIAGLEQLAHAVSHIPANMRLEEACASCSSTLHEVIYRNKPLIRTSGLSVGPAEALLDQLERLLDQA